MHTLIPRPQQFRWGSTTLIPEFLGAAPTGTPVAEAWFGAHPSAPSGTENGPDLATLLAGEPDRTLGRDVVTRFGEQLPYLLKLIAPVRPLSLQVHPNLEQAEAGHRRELARGIGPTRRNYPDANHKPEMVYALSTFEAVCGFRAPRRVAELLAGLDAPLAGELASILDADPSAEGVRSAFGRLLGNADGDEVTAVARNCRERLATGDSPSPRADALVAMLAEEYPGDPGAVAVLLLNPVTLQPGEALFVPPGCVHSYLSGFAVELMANSDNVLRAGLTVKHVDVPELLATVDCVAAPPIRIAPETVGCTEIFYAPVDDFELSVARRIGGAPARLRGRGPRILLGLEGAITVRAGDHERVLNRGESLFLGADETPVLLAGTGRLVQAGVP